MKKYYVTICMALLLAVANLHAQTAKGVIKGRLADTTSGQVLRRASIKVINDSALVASGITDSSGHFVITRIPKGAYTLKVEFSGYDPRTQVFKITDSSFVLDAGTIYMQLHENALKDVVVETPPIVIKTDTTEYNAQLYNVKPNSSVQDLLQKLPGVDVDNQGNIKAQGESVSRVLVDGKRFFGDDPKMATQNLPSDIIDKIQVFDDLSDQSKFTGFDDGNRVKTINIITKKNMRRGYFGKLIAGAANKSLYDEAAQLSKFKGDEQVTFIGQGNNTNKQNFTVQDIFGGGGGGRGGAAGGIGGGAGGGFGGAGGNRAGTGGGIQSLASPTGTSGLNTTWAGGLNYRNTWGKTDAYGSYFYSNILTYQQQKSNTENFYSNGDPSLFNNQYDSSVSRVINQRINFNVESAFDSSNSIVVRPNISVQQTNGFTATNTNTLRGTTLIDSAVANAASHTSGYNGSNDALFRHRFKKKGRTFSLDLSWSGNLSNGTGTNYSSSIYSRNNKDSLSLINQYYTSYVNTQTVSPTFSYTEPIGKKSIIEFNYNYTYTKNIANRYTYAFDSAAKGYTILDSLLTNTYESNYNSNRAVLSYRYQNTNLNFSIGNGVQFGNLTSINTSKNDTVSQKYVNIYPTANLTYRFTRNTTLKFNYSGRTSQPSAQQLEPIINNADPMNIQIGNPALKQTFSNTFRLLFTSFDPVKFRNMFASINASFVNNNIVNQTVTNLITGVDSIKPVNLNGTYNFSGFFNYGFPLKKPKSNLNLTTNLSVTRGISSIGTDSLDKIILPQVNYTTNYTMGETVKWTTNLKKNFDVNFSASPTYNIAHYAPKDSSIQYFSLGLTVEATYFTQSGWILTAQLYDTYYGGRESAYNTNVPLLNLALARQIFKNKRGEIRLTVYDAINQNVSISRTVTNNYVQDTQTKLLTRYALLTFTYNIRSFKGAAPQQQNNRRGGRGGFPGGGFPGGAPDGGGAGPL
jgi:hypothetical protein